MGSVSLNVNACSNFPDVANFRFPVDVVHWATEVLRGVSGEADACFIEYCGVWESYQWCIWHF